MNCNICIPVVERTIDNIEIVLQCVRNYIEHKEIILIGKKDLKDKCLSLGCEFVDEDQIQKGLSFGSIKELLMQNDPYASYRTGWYLQQFLTYSYAYICPDEYYIIWDSDLIPLKNIRFFDDNGKPYFDLKKEFHRPYFTVMRKLFDGRIKRTGAYSYISEHMVIKTEYMVSMLDDIESNKKLKGNLYFEKIMNSIHTIDIPGSGFSDYETYGCYVDTMFPDQYIHRRLKSLREGDYFLRRNPTEEELKWASQSYDWINIEHRHMQLDDIRNDYDNIIGSMSLEQLVEKYSDRVFLI